MSRDVKNGARPRPRGQQGPSMGVGIVVGLLLGLGLAVGVVYFTGNLRPDFSNLLANQPKTGVGASATPTPAAPSPEVLKPQAKEKDKAPAPQQYTFYGILSGQEKPKATEPAKAADPEAAPAAPAEPKQAYLQAGAFQNEGDADDLKAKLAMLGVEANIQKISQPDQSVLHRVRVGPLPMGTELDQLRDSLKQNGIETMVTPAGPAKPSKPKALAAKPAAAPHP